MFGYSLAASNRQADLGYDISQYRITKMYTDDESIRIVGTQEGEIFAFDTEGALLWNVGKPIARAVYDIGMEEGHVYVIYADGQILAFSAEEASEYNGTADESFLGQCVVYSVGVSFALAGHHTGGLCTGPFRGTAGGGLCGAGCIAGGAEHRGGHQHHS